MNKKGKLICIKQCSNCGKDVEIRHKERMNRTNNEISNLQIMIKKRAYEFSWKNKKQQKG